MNESLIRFLMPYIVAIREPYRMDISWNFQHMEVPLTGFMK
jgi:hypothetical protein